MIKDTLTIEDKERLRAFWNAQAVLKRDGEQVIGQYRPDLIMDADQDTVNLSLASMEPAHWHVTEAPDGFYYLKEGMEPPKDTLGFYRGLWELLKWWVPMGAASVAVWWLWVTLWPETIKWLLWLSGR